MSHGISVAASQVSLEYCRANHITNIVRWYEWLSTKLYDRTNRVFFFKIELLDNDGRAKVDKCTYYAVQEKGSISQVLAKSNQYGPKE